MMRWSRPAFPGRGQAERPRGARPRWCIEWMFSWFAVLVRSEDFESDGDDFAPFSFDADGGPAQPSVNRVLLQPFDLHDPIRPLIGRDKQPDVTGSQKVIIALERQRLGG